MTSRSFSSLLFGALVVLNACTQSAITPEDPQAGSGTGSETIDVPDAPDGTGTACGGIGGLQCGAGEFCDLGASCHTPDAMGTCREPRQACTREFNPVCGCDGRTYPTACTAHAQRVSVLHDGPCNEPTGATNASGGTEGATCGTRGIAPCAEGLSCIHPMSANCGATDAPGTCQRRPEICTMDYNPVCGCDGRTYGNACGAAGAGVSVRTLGECPG